MPPGRLTPPGRLIPPGGLVPPGRTNSGHLSVNVNNSE